MNFCAVFVFFPRLSHPARRLSATNNYAMGLLLLTTTRLLFRTNAAEKTKTVRTDSVNSAVLPRPDWKPI